MSRLITTYQEYVRDSRKPCKYGENCYQKNSLHHRKFKHPPKNLNNPDKHVNKKIKLSDNESVANKDISDSEHSDGSLSSSETRQASTLIDKLSASDSDTEKSEGRNEVQTNIDKEKRKLSDETVANNDISDSEHSDGSLTSSGTRQTSTLRENLSASDSDTEKSKGSNEVQTNFDEENGDESSLQEVDKSEENIYVDDRTDTKIVHKIIKQRFLVNMPDDFYKFWNFCRKLKPNNVTEALKEVGLTLIGPYDILAGKFNNINKNSEEYLIHWRYFRDPPECQAVLRGDDGTGFHIAYFRDSPEDEPVFLIGNHVKKNGILTAMGDNIFSAVNIYLEDLKKTGDPFKRMHIGRIQAALTKEAEQNNIDMSRKTKKMVDREKKIVSRTFNKIGLVVPYDKKSEVGYRELALDDKALNNLLTKLQQCSPDQRPKFLSELQPVLTYASIAADECDFGTSIELGWNMMAHGVECLNDTIMRFLVTGYQLLNKHEFAKIAEAHMKNRRQGCRLSIL